MLSDSLAERLREILGHANLLLDPADCWTYGFDNSRRQLSPLAVAFPTTSDQIGQLIATARNNRIALVPRGSGTGTTGGAVPVENSIVMALERMDSIIDIDPGNRTMHVQPGVINDAVQQAAAEHGLFWAPDPGSSAFCTVGGNLAFNAAGPRAVKYGTTRENVLGLKAITGAGKEIVTGTNTTKGVVGYDLTRLIIGSEGTLAVITEATLKLLPLPESRRTVMASYASIDAATRAIISIMTQPVMPCAVEFIDRPAIDMIRDFSDADLPQHAGALLLVEVDGAVDCLDSSVQSVSAALNNDGLLEQRIATTEAESRQLWATRKALSPALRKIAPNKLNEDVVVPVTRIPDLIHGIERLSEQYHLSIVNFGHAGNGNIHVNLLYDNTDPAQDASARQCLRSLFTLVLELGGTLSGEHGIGIEKRDYISQEIDTASLDLMRKLKTVFDPDNILNPGKIFPSP